MAARKRNVEQPEQELIAPLDYLLLAELPGEGETAGGLYPLGRTVRSIADKEPFKGVVNSDTIAGRIRSMSFLGLTVSVTALGGARTGSKTHGGLKAWQVTTKGQEVLKAWQSRQ